MAYNKTVWVNNTTPVNADNMNKIENQLETLDTGKLDKTNVVNTTTQTESEGKALNAVQLNPNISGTLANKAKVLNDDRGYLDSKEYSGDLNSLVVNGIYRTSTSTTNKPLSTSDRFTVFVMKDSNTTTQLAICSYSVAFANSNRAFTRVMIDGSWSEWKEIKTVDFRTLASLGLSDDNMSATDFGSNLAAILNAMPQYGTFKNYIYSSTPNLFASINTTAIATSDGYMLEIQKTANNTVPNKVILHPNTSSGVVREQVGYYDNAWGGWREVAVIRGVVNDINFDTYTLEGTTIIGTNSTGTMPTGQSATTVRHGILRVSKTSVGVIQELFTSNDIAYSAYAGKYYFRNIANSPTTAWQEIATTTKTSFNITANTGYKITSQTCYVTNGFGFIKAQLRKEDESAFTVGTQIACAKIPLSVTTNCYISGICTTSGLTQGYASVAIDGSKTIYITPLSTGDRINLGGFFSIL